MSKTFPTENQNFFQNFHSSGNFSPLRVKEQFMHNDAQTNESYMKF